MIEINIYVTHDLSYGDMFQETALVTDWYMIADHPKLANKNRRHEAHFKLHWEHDSPP